MPGIDEEIAQLLRQGGGALASRHHPRLERALQRRARVGVLFSPLPGVFISEADRRDPDVRIRAAVLRAPEAVLTGHAAARWSFWPELAVPVVTMSSPVRRCRHAGYLFTREALPPEVTTYRGDARLTMPALTALDLARDRGGEGIDRALLTRSATLAQMAEALALTSHRRGNSDRAALLRDSRDEPWSEAERRLHALLRMARIKGWQANVDVRIGATHCIVDIAFRGLRVAIEVDGYAVHRSENREQFHRDRRKWTALTAAGWRVLHFTWAHLVDDADWVVATIQATVIEALSEKRRGRQ
ncbi:MAG: endonuclease domain-containing protein [Jatrophihabitans sp.]